MLTRIRIRGFKSLRSVEVAFGPLTILYGPAAAGKSNFIEALTLLSRLATSQNLPEAWEPIRGTPDEGFSFGHDRICLEADFQRPRAGQPRLLKHPFLHYHGEISISRSSGLLRFIEESLASSRPRHGRRLLLKRSIRYPLTPDQSILSYGGEDRAPELAAIQQELGNWRFYDLDFHKSTSKVPSAEGMRDIGARGQHLCFHLHWLQRSLPRQFAAIERALEMVYPWVSKIHLQVDDCDRVHLALVEQGISVPASLLSKGILRMLGFFAALSRPGPRLAGFEEPAAGFHPSQVLYVAELFKVQAALHGVQIIATTTTPAFVRLADPLAYVYRVSNRPEGTHIAKLTALESLDEFSL